jgi:hypothetical protein
MTSEIKVNKVSDSCGSALVTKCGANITLGASGKTVRIACGASTVGMGRTGTVDWCTTAKTSPFTSVNGKGYFVNTTSGTVTVTLPASPTAGSIIAVKDYANTWNSNKIEICRNGSKLGSVCGNTCLTTQGQSVTLIYVDSTQGWLAVNDSTSDATGGSYIAATGGNTILTDGNYKTHVFTSDGNFIVTAGQGDKAIADYFVVAGGGGGGLEEADSTAAGGGGAGGFRLSNGPASGIASCNMSPLASTTSLALTAQTYPVTVGAGGTRASSPQPTMACRPGGDGGASTFSTITSAGGGGGSGQAPGPNSGRRGGSGGGGKQDNGYNGATSPCGSVSGGTGNYPPVSPPQGNNGGNSDMGPLAPGQGGSYMSGGGGGAGAVGVPGAPQSVTTQGCGGAGSYISTTVFGPASPTYGTSGPVGTARYFSGGGGGGGVGSVPHVRKRGAGGDGGGGYGGSPPNAPANAGTDSQAGTANTGGGGGGGGNKQPNPNGSTPAPIRQGETGGSGVVFIRYRYQ